MSIDSRSLEVGPLRDRAVYDSAVARLQADTIARVNQDLRGQEVRLVHAALVERLQGRLPGARLDDRNLWKIAAAISTGTLPDWPGSLAPRPPT